MLLLPDLLAFWLCGAAVAEHTVAATTQCYDPERRAWATVNKSDRGGKKSGSGRGKKSSKSSARAGGRKGGRR